MKIIIDTTQKTVNVLGEDTLNNLFKELEKIIPLDDWDNYKIKMEKEIVEYPVYPTYPINSPHTPYPPYPWEGTIPIITYNINDHFIKEPENK